MVWELAGNYGRNAVKGQYEQGSTPTTAMYDRFKSATPYGAKRSTIDLPAQALDVDVSFDQFPLGDSNYPISPKRRSRPGPISGRRGRKRRILPVRLAGTAYAGYRRGGHPTPERAVGKAMFEDFLAQCFGRPERSE